MLQKYHTYLHYILRRCCNKYHKNLCYIRTKKVLQKNQCIHCTTAKSAKNYQRVLQKLLVHYISRLLTEIQVLRKNGASWILVRRPSRDLHGPDSGSQVVMFLLPNPRWLEQIMVTFLVFLKNTLDPKKPHQALPLSEDFTIRFVKFFLRRVATNQKPMEFQLEKLRITVGPEM